ncbi:MAG: asparaginase [Bacteroidia bacterium]|jgi:L-asparaginase II|nr:asparaginase [Bacteroidia bacterium]
MSNPILVEIYRGSVLESFHRGVVCIVNHNAEVILQAGDIQQICYPRSAMKLLQALPLIERGGVEHFKLSNAELAVICGSHNGESFHVAAVDSILAKIGLTRNALLCGPQFPTSRAASNNLIKAGLKPEAIHNNCSGKHAGMLATCVLNGWSTHDYLNANHPLQQAILNVCSEMYQYPKTKMTTALDGCSAPIYAVPVYNQAVGYANLVNPRLPEQRKNACNKIIQAISQHPEMVAGTARYCSDMMKITAPEVIGKTGAEGIFCMAFTNIQLGVCIKIDDGKMDPQYGVAQAIIEASGLFSTSQLQTLHAYAERPIANFNKWETGTYQTNREWLEPFSRLL